MILVDSSVWIDYFNGKVNAETDFLDSIADSTNLAIGDLILTEVLQGFRQEKEFVAARAVLETFPVLTLVGQTNAVLAAQNYRLLRKRGVTVRSTIDCLIATYCVANEFSLLHTDRDFMKFEEHLGLQVLHL